MATPKFGSIGEFDSTRETFSAYIERTQLYFTANDVADDKKVAVLLTELGSMNYSLLRSLLSPTLPKDKTFDELVQTLGDHFEPKPVVIAERFHFHRRNQALRRDGHCIPCRITPIVHTLPICE